MARGQASNVGATRVAPNGYHYTKTEDGWELTHRVLAATKLGRPLHFNERAYFKDGDKTNIVPENIEVRVVKKVSAQERIEQKREQIKQLEFEISLLEEQIRLESDTKSLESVRA